MRDDFFDDDFTSVRDIQLDGKVRSDNALGSNAKHVPRRQHVCFIVSRPYHRFSGTW